METPQDKIISAKLTFHCLDCKSTYKFDSDEDPTTSTGCCKVCGSSRWQIFDYNGVSLAG